MVFDHIRAEHELYEVLNAFPFLWDVFTNLEIPLENVMEGISLKDYLLYQGFSLEEGNHIIKRLNREVSLFLKYGEVSKSRPLAKEKQFVDVNALL